MKYLRNVETVAEVVDPKLDSPSVFFCQENQQIRIFVADESMPNNEIWYTTTDEQVFESVDFLTWWGEDEEYNPNLASKIRYTLLSNTYENGIGKMVFAENIQGVGFLYHYNEDESAMIIDDVYPLLFSEDSEKLSSVILPSTVAIIGSCAFQENRSLSSVTIPELVTSIGDDAFYGCSGLTSITIPELVTSIGEYAFYGCSGLTSITIPNSVASIGKQAFFKCKNLTSVTIPELVTEIEEKTFYLCSGITFAVIDGPVTSIGEYAFYGCSSLTSVNYNGTVAQWNAITKGTRWRGNVPSTTVVTCTDGTTPLG